MPIEQLWDLVQEQALHIQFPKPLLQCRGAVCDDVQDLRHKRLIRGDLAVPALHKLAHDDGEEGIQLQIDIVAARQRWQQLLDRQLGISALVAQLLRAQRPADEAQRGPIRQRVDRSGTIAPAICHGTGLGRRRGGGMLGSRRRRGSGGSERRGSGGGGGHGRRVRRRRGSIAREQAEATEADAGGRCS